MMTHRMDPFARPAPTSHSGKMPTSYGDKLSNLGLPTDVFSPIDPVFPQELFVEMDELKDGEWQEQARWIKYEEDLLDGAGRWGRAHISSLSFHSVINVRLVLEHCKFEVKVTDRLFGN